MSRKMLIEFPSYGVAMTAVLEDGVNPELCDDVWENLPMDAYMEHGVVTGKIMYCWAPMISTAPVHVAELHTEAPVGRVQYSQATGNKIIINYGWCSEDLPAPVLAQIVPEDLESLKVVGKNVWDAVYCTKELIPVKFSRKEN